MDHQSDFDVLEEGPGWAYAFIFNQQGVMGGVSIEGSQDPMRRTLNRT